LNQEGVTIPKSFGFEAAIRYGAIQINVTQNLCCLNHALRTFGKLFVSLCCMDGCNGLGDI
ncbi:MAG: hypothetical protein ACE5NM_10470, partial [Sedimentisphaerales bacterium]